MYTPGATATASAVSVRAKTGSGVGSLFRRASQTMTAKTPMTTATSARRTRRPRGPGRSGAGPSPPVIRSLRDGCSRSARGSGLPGRRLDDVLALVQTDVVEPLDGPARPGDFDLVNGRLVAQPEMEGVRRLRQVAAGRLDLPRHHLALLVDADDGPDRVAIAPRAPQAEGDVVPPRALVPEQVRLVVEVVDHDVKPAGPGEVGDRGAPRAADGLLAVDRLGQCDPPGRRLDAEGGGHVAERAVALVHHQAVGPVVERVAHARRDEDVEVAVVVEVALGDAPRPEGLQAGAV